MGFFRNYAHQYIVSQLGCRYKIVRHAVLHCSSPLTDGRENSWINPPRLSLSSLIVGADKYFPSYKN